MCVYDSDAFNERVNFAASYISGCRPSTRRFDTCFEMNDGNVVIAALVRRAETRPHGKLAANLFDYISEDNAREKARALENVKTADLKHEAAKARARAERAFDEWLQSKQTA